MSSPLAPSQSHPTQHSVQLPRELWCDIIARILGDYLYDLIIGTDTRSDDDYEDENEDQRPRTITHADDTCQCSIKDQPEWDAIATLLHISRLVRSCTLDHLAFLCHRPGTPPPVPSHDPDSGTRTPSFEHDDDYRPLVAHLRALRDDGIDTLVLEEWDYVPRARFFGLPRSLMGTCARAEMEEEQGQGQGQGLPPILVLARLRHTLAASDAFACEGWDWFPYNAPEVYDAGCTALLVSTYRAVPAYARSALLRRVVERIAKLQVARITRAIERTRNRIELTQTLFGAKYQGHIAHPAAKTSSEDLLVSVTRMLATELNITL